MSEPKPFKKWHLILLLIIIAMTIAFRIYGAMWTKATVKIAGQEIRVLVADTEKHRIKGWSDRKDMGKYGGMLFVFPNASRHAMVMRDMRFPLDIVWIYGNRIIDIAPNAQPEPDRSESELTVYSARTTSTLVLELPAGFMQSTGLKIGDIVEIEK